MRHRRRWLIGTIVAASAIGGCAHDRPTVELVDARVAERAPDAAVVRFTLQATNTNRIELPLRVVRYSLTLGGVRVFEGVRFPEATLRRLGTQTLELPVAFALPVEGVPASGPVPYEIEGQLRYTTPGEIAQLLFDAGVRRPSLRFRGEGTIDLGGEGRSGAAQPADRADEQAVNARRGADDPAVSLQPAPA